jgi:4-amino-4-deoxy-L-arabinose transferase-like glycosyltransferase
MRFFPEPGNKTDLYGLSRRENVLLAVFFILLIPSLFFNLGLVPLYAEEPRRAVVALEMLLRENFIVPTINGEFYYLKPPFFNWILASVYTVAGSPDEFNTRITSVVSMLLLGLVMYMAGKKYAGRSFGLLSAALWLTAAGNLFFNSLLAEIDLFYSLVTFTSLIALFHFYEKKHFYLLFISIYLLGAIGTLTKGAPSILFTGLSVLVYFFMMKDFRRLFSAAHFTGIAVYAAVVGGYFLAYSMQGDVVTYLKFLFLESGKRFSGDTIWDFIVHMLIYPFDTLWNLLPASLLIIFLFRRRFLQICSGNPLVRFALLMLIVHFPVYWLPPGGKQRYILMLYPFIIQLLAYVYLIALKEPGKKIRIFHRVLAFGSAAMAILAFAPLLIAGMDNIANLWLICLVGALAFASIAAFQFTQPRFAMTGMLFTLLTARLFFSLTVLPERAEQGSAAQNRAMAAQFIELTSGENIGIFQGTDFPMQAIYYLERGTMAIIPKIRLPMPGQNLILEKYMLRPYEVYRTPTTPVYSAGKEILIRNGEISPGPLDGLNYLVKSDTDIQRSPRRSSRFLLIRILDE